MTKLEVFFDPAKQALPENAMILINDRRIDVKAFDMSLVPGQLTQATLLVPVTEFQRFMVKNADLTLEIVNADGSAVRLEKVRFAEDGPGTKVEIESRPK